MHKALKTFIPTVTNMIRADHTHVLATFHQYEIDTSPGTKRALVNTICAGLEIHAQLEEEIFYPAMREVAGDAGVYGPVAEALADRDRYRAAGLARAAQFSWRRTAELTIGAYRKVLDA